MTQLVIIDNHISSLPFHSVMSWEQFQEFCTDLLYLVNNDSVDSREYLRQGSKQDGIDVYTTRKGQEKLTVAQCKLKEYISPSEIDEIVDKFIEGNFVETSEEFIICTSYDLGKLREYEEVFAKAREKLGNHGIKLTVWDQNGISMTLRTHPKAEIMQIVYRHFGEEISLKFYGEMWEKYLRTLRKVAKHDYSASAYHIERNLRHYNSSPEEVEENPWRRWKDIEKSSLIEAIENTVYEGSVKIALLSTAGYGKTEELKNLAAFFSKQERLIHPIKFLLRDYVGQSVETLLLSYDEDWRNIERGNILLILDGFDEIESSHLQVFVNQLNAFIEQNPKINVVVSSRYNFYDVKHPPLRGFKILILDPLTREDIKIYLERVLPTDESAREKILNEDRFEEYLSNPYYITRLVSYYQKYAVFPQKKSDLLDMIMFERMEEDSEKYLIPELKEQLLPSAKLIAFYMTVTGRSSFSDNEISIIVAEPNIRRSLNHLGIINRNATGEGRWSFEHKNIQEHLCATKISELGVLNIINLITYEHDRSRMIPKFLNTVAFLFEIFDKNSEKFGQLFNWIHQHEPELFIRFEKDQLSKNTRLSIFKMIYNKYKSAGKSLNSTYFNDEELAAFIDFDNSFVDFLEAEIKSCTVQRLIFDLLTILGLAKRPYVYKNHALRILNYVLDNQSFENFLYAKTISLFSTFGIVDEDQFKKILESKIDFTDYQIRKSCLAFLENSIYYEAYTEFIVSSIRVFIESPQSNQYAGNFTTLKNLIFNLNSPASVKRIFQAITINLNTLSIPYHSNEFSYTEEEINSLFGKAVEVYKIDRIIAQIIYRLYRKIEYLNHKNPLLSMFKFFFESTCGVEVIFKKVYKYSKRDFNLVFFANNSCCDYVIDEYCKSKVTEQDLIYYRNVMFRLNYETFKYFYDKLLLIDRSVFEVEDLNVDYRKIHTDQKLKNQQMLLDRSIFFDEAKEIFAAISKTDISFNDLYDHTIVKLARFYESIVYKSISDCFSHNRRNALTLEEFVHKYQNEVRWQDLVIRTIYTMLKEEKSNVNEKLVSIISSWCYQNIPLTQFEGTIKHDGPRTSFNGKVEFIKEVVVLLNMDLEDNMLVKILPSVCDGMFSNSNTQEEKFSSFIIRKIKDIDLLKSAILTNIRNKKLEPLVLCSHYCLCQILKINACVPLLYQDILFNNKLRDYERIKLTEFYLDMGGQIEDFAEYIVMPIHESSDAKYESWHWFLLDKLLFLEPEKCEVINLTIIESDMSLLDKLLAAKYLIKQSRIEGLLYVEQYFKMSHKFPFLYDWSNLESSLNALPVDLTLPIFLRLLQFTYEHNLEYDSENHFYIDGAIQHLLLQLSVKGKHYFHQVLAEVDRLLSMFTSSSTVHSLTTFRSQLTLHFYDKIYSERKLQDYVSTYYNIM